MKKKSKKPIKKEPTSIFEEGKVLKGLARDELLPLLKELEKKKIQQGYSWKVIDLKTRVLTKDE